MRAIKPATLRDVQNVRRAAELLREARDLLAKAGARRTYQRVRLAITSADGALRHVEARHYRTTNG